MWPGRVRIRTTASRQLGISSGIQALWPSGLPRVRAAPAGRWWCPAELARPSDPDPLLGLDIFFASNLSLKNPNFRTGRCGECHAIPTLTDHTMPFTSKINLMDAVAEFAAPGVELIVEPLARLRVISGFLLEAEINENGQDAVERRIVDQSIVPNPVDGFAYPGATAAGLPRPMAGTSARGPEPTPPSWTTAYTTWGFDPSPRTSAGAAMTPLAGRCPCDPDDEEPRGSRLQPWRR